MTDNKKMLSTSRDQSLKAYLMNKIKQNGGWVNSHMHADRAFTITVDKIGRASCRERV